MGLYVGDSDNITVCLGATEVSAMYIGDVQVYPLSPFAVSPSSIHLSDTVLTAVIRIKSPEAWTITDTSGGWLSYSASSGAAGTTTVTVTATAPSATRTATISVTTANYSKNISVEQLYITFTGFYVENVSQQNGTLTVLEGVNLSHNLEYSTDGSTWTTATTGSPCLLPVAAGSKLYLRGTNSDWRAQTDGHNSFDMDVDWKIGGNMLSIIDKDNYQTLSSVPDYGFQNAFSISQTLVDTSDANVGVATYLGRNSFHNILNRSPRVVGCPDISTITDGGYWCFIGACIGCYALTTPFDLRNMTSINNDGNTTTAMYENCSSLTYAYAPNIVGWQAGNVWLSGTAANGTLYVPTGFVGTARMPSTWTMAYYN